MAVVVVLALAVAAVVVVVAGDDARTPGAVTVQGEAAVDTNIPTARHRQAAQGAYLALSTEEPPPDDGWYATYEVDVPAAGVYRLEAVATPPVEQPHVEDYGSVVALAVNDGRSVEVARPQPHWMVSPAAWGELSRLTLDEVQLRRGRNTVTVRVDQPTSSTGVPRYRLLLDELRFTPVDLAVASVHLGDPAANVGIYRAGPAPDLRIALNGTAPRRLPVRYRVVDHVAAEVASGTVTVAAGATAAAVRLPDLPPGHYRATARLASSSPRTSPAGAGVGPSGAEAVGTFARLPDQQAVRGAANRFGVNTFVASTVPPSRLDAVAAALGSMGAGYAREANPTPGTRPATAAGDPHGRVVRTLHEHGLEVVEFLVPEPSWEVTGTSQPLPEDLRDAYRTARSVADLPDGARPDAVQLWNEPDNDATASTGDHHAAYAKAAALGLADGRYRPLTVLSGIAGEDNGFQELMLQNDVARYADVWSFHAYPDPAEQEAPTFPGSEEQHELRRLHGADIPVWATESGVFLDGGRDGALTADQQAVQARYLVQSTVEDLAAGTDRHLWFIGPPTFDGGIQFGLLGPGFQPQAAYSAHAAMAGLLGEATIVDQAIDLETATARFRFDAGDHAVTVLWSAAPTEVAVPVPGTRVAVHDIMGRRLRTATPDDDGTVRVEASPDPFYLVSDAPAPPPTPASPTPPAPGPSSVVSAAPGGAPARAGDPAPAERIVLSQRFAPENAAPNKDDGDAEPPLGYRLDGRARMTVDVYNFDDTAHTVAVSGRGYGGWVVEPVGETRVQVPPMGRAGVEHTVTPGGDVRPGVDHPLVFEAVLADGDADDADTVTGGQVPPSVSRVQLPAAEPGEPLPLAPSITELVPADGAAVDGPAVTLSARITDPLSGVDATRVEVEVDGIPVPGRFDPTTGRLSAPLSVGPGTHEVRIRAYNRAHAPAQASATLTVR